MNIMGYNIALRHNGSENAKECFYMMDMRERQNKDTTENSRENCINETSCEQIDYINIMYVYKLYV